MVTRWKTWTSGRLHYEHYFLCVLLRRIRRMTSLVALIITRAKHVRVRVTVCTIVTKNERVCWLIVSSRWGKSIQKCGRIWEKGSLWSGPKFWDIDMLWNYRESAVIWCMFHVHSCLDSLFMCVYISYFGQPQKSLLKISERIAGHYGS